MSEVIIWKPFPCPLLGIFCFLCVCFWNTRQSLWSFLFFPVLQSRSSQLQRLFCPAPLLKKERVSCSHTQRVPFETPVSSPSLSLLPSFLLMSSLWYITHSLLKPCPVSPQLFWPERESIALTFLLAYYSWSPNPPQKKATSEWGISSSEWAGTVRSLQTCLAWCHLVFLAGWYEGERLRDGERGWFPMECAKEITCQATIDKNVERMGRLLGLETNV